VSAAAHCLRVLVVTFGSLAAPRGGTQVRARNAVDALRRLGHEVSAICVMRSLGGHDNASRPEEQAIGAAYAGEKRLRELVVVETPVVFGWSPRLAALARRMARGCDVVVVENALLFGVTGSARRRSALVWDTNELQSLHYGRLPGTSGNRLRTAAWRAVESWGSRLSDVAIAISDDEARWWEDLHPGLRGRVQVVEHRPVLSQQDGVHPWRPPGVPADDAVLVFVGNLGAKQNASAARWLGSVATRGLAPGMHLVLAGPGSGSIAVPAAARSQVWCLDEVGDVDAVIAGADLCLAPLAAGAGVKTKVLHYIAHGKPVLGTPSAFEGIHDAPGVTSLALEHLAAEMLPAVRAARADPGLAGRQRAWFEAHHAPAVVDDQWRSVLESAVVALRARSPER